MYGLTRNQARVGIVVLLMACCLTLAACGGDESLTIGPTPGPTATALPG